MFFLITFGFCQNLSEGTYYEDIGGLKINYTIRGNGPVMIVGHLSSGKIGYELTLKPLEKYFTMVYYAPRGTGKSEVPKSIDAYNQYFIVEEIENLRKKLNVESIWIFGHSDQSAVALEYALKYPKQTIGLILTGTSLIGNQQDTYDRRAKSEKKRTQESPWFAQVVKDWDYMLEHNTQTDANGRNLSEAPIKWWCYDGETAQKVLPIVKEITKAGRRKPVDNQFVIETKEEREKYLEIQKQFPSIKTNILIINGKYDTNNPPQYAEQLHKVLPNSKLVLIDYAGHFPWIENEEETFREIEIWLKQVKM